MADVLTTWSDVEVSLDAYDAARVRRTLREVLAANIAEPGGRSPSHPIAVALFRALGAWYADGPHVGDESVRDWCWCHSFWAPWDATRSRDANLDALTDGLMGEIEAARQWRLQLARWIWDRPPCTADTLQPDLIDLVGHLVELGLHDSWYVHVPTAATWFLEAHGHPVTPALSEQIEALAERSFTSWSIPSAGDRASFAESAAWEVFEAVFDSRIPPSDQGDVG